MKTVLILGGSYFCGRVCIENITNSKDFDIHVFNRGNIPIGMPDISERRGDREIAADISETIPDIQWDAVIDLCAYDPDHINLIFDNLKGSVGHYILISTTSVYKYNSDEPLKENAAKVQAPQYELGEFADYGYKKVLAERALIQRCKSSNTQFTILRPSIIYGRYNYAHVNPTFSITLLMVNRLLFLKTQWQGSVSSGWTIWLN